MPRQHRFRGCVSFLAIDTPVFEFVQRNVLAGDGAANVGAGGGYAKIAVEIFDLSLAMTGGSEFIEHEKILQRRDACAARSEYKTSD